MTNKVILTGFAGFIGSQILRDLIGKGFDVIGIDNLSLGSNPKNYLELQGKFLPLFFDITNPSLFKYMQQYVDQVDYVINCAAESHVDRSWDQVSTFINTNVYGAINVATMALNLKCTKFVHVSTDEVFAGDSQPFHENSKLSPRNAYATSKASAELFLKNYYKAYNLPLVITNGANTYGPRQYPEKIIPKTISKIVNNEKIPLFKTPARRMWLHVEDHSQGIIQAMLYGRIGENYCLAPTKENELYTEDLVKMICDIMNVDFQQYIQYVEDRPNYDLRYHMLNYRAISDLKWSPLKNIKKELAEVVFTYLS